MDFDNLMDFEWILMDFDGFLEYDSAFFLYCVQKKVLVTTCSS